MAGPGDPLALSDRITDTFFPAIDYLLNKLVRRTSASSLPHMQWDAVALVVLMQHRAKPAHATLLGLAPRNTLHFPHACTSSHMA